MPKLIFLCARRPGLTPEAYAAHLLERHAPLALRHHATLRRYVLNVVQDGDARAGAIDSVNALHYESLGDFQTRNYDSAEGERIVTEDHARFLGGAAGYATEERVHRDVHPPVPVGQRSAGSKWICALRRSSRVSAERFADALASELAPEILAGQPGATRVVVDRVLGKLFPGGPDWDAFLETSFADAVRAPVHPFDSFDCAVCLRGRVARLTDGTAVWRVAEYVERA